MEMESYKEHFQYYDGRHQITQRIRYAPSVLALREIRLRRTSHMLVPLYA